MKRSILLVPLFMLPLSSQATEPTADPFDRLVSKVFAKTRMVGKCKMWISGNEDGSFDLTVQQKNTEPGILTLSPPSKTNGRSLASESAGGRVLEYRESDAVGWVVLEVLLGVSDKEKDIPKKVRAYAILPTGKEYRQYFHCGSK